MNPAFTGMQKGCDERRKNGNEGQTDVSRMPAFQLRFDGVHTPPSFYNAQPLENCWVQAEEPSIVGDEGRHDYGKPCKR